MIVVLDTNIIASATYWRGKPAHCLEAWIQGRFDLAISHPILTEYEEVVARLAVGRYPDCCCHRLSALARPARKPRMNSHLVQMFSFTGDTVLDPFCGTGTTMVAALKHGRNSMGVELDPAYCQQAASRLLHENTNLFGNARLQIDLKRREVVAETVLHERGGNYKTRLPRKLLRNKHGL